MPRKLNAQIRQFVSHFNAQLELIGTLRSGDNRGRQRRFNLAMHKEILYLSVIDSLAGICYPEIGENAMRFRTFLAEHAGWNEGASVSVPVLEARLHPRVLDSRLARHVLKLLRRHNPFSPNGLPAKNVDVKLSDLEARTSTPKGFTMVRQSQHFQLLYLYRNFVVHEFREPGYAMEVFGESRSEPWYHSYIDVPKWHLLYPVGFFERLAISSVSSIEGHLLKRAIDPYLLVSNTTKWPKNIRRSVGAR